MTPKMIETLERIKATPGQPITAFGLPTVRALESRGLVRVDYPEGGPVGYGDSRIKVWAA